MCADWFNKSSKKNAIDPRVVLDEIAKVSSVDAQGNVRFALRGLPDNLDVILESAIKFDPDIPQCAYASLVRKAIHNAVRAGRIESGFVLTAIQNAEIEYRALPMHDYILVSAISFALPFPFRTLYLGQIKLSLKTTPPRKFDRSALRKSIEVTFPMPLPTNFATLLVRLQARTKREAADVALKCLSEQVGIWNYILTRGAVSLFYGPGRPAVGALAVGPVHTLHLTNGQIVEDLFWYEPSYISPPSPLSLKPNEAATFIRSDKLIRRRMQRMAARERISHAFRVYGEALQETSLDVAFLKLWAVLELLTDTTQDTAEKTIRRVSFVFENPEFLVQELRHIRDRRNRLVHLNESTENRQTNVHLLKSYVDHMFDFLLDSVNRDKKIEEIGEFLDQTTDMSKLARDIELLKSVKRFRIP